MILAVAASIHKVMYVLVDVGPVDGEAGSCFKAGYALMCFMEPAA